MREIASEFRNASFQDTQRCFESTLGCGSRSRVQRFAPDFVFAGPQRTGSTWLDHVLRKSREVTLPDAAKETFFFDENYEKGLAWYRSHFPRECAGLVGEIGPSYFDVPEASARIKSLNPECRIVVTLRDPAERAFSLFLHHLKKGRVPANLREACKRMPRLLSSGQFQEHIPRWVDAFGSDRVRILRYEDIEINSQAWLRSVAMFLGLGDGFTDGAIEGRFNASSLPRFPWLAQHAARLVTKLKSHRLHTVVELGKRLGLKKIYSGASTMPTLAARDREWLIEQHTKAINYCERDLRWNVADWRRVSTAG